MTEFETNVIEWLTALRKDLADLDKKVQGIGDKFLSLPCKDGNCPAKTSNSLNWKKWLALGGGIGLGLSGGAGVLAKILGGF